MQNAESSVSTLMTADNFERNIQVEQLEKRKGILLPSLIQAFYKDFIPHPRIVLSPGGMKLMQPSANLQ